MSTPTTEQAKNCGSCGHWFCPLQKRDIGVGQCRLAPPVSSFSWPRTREHQFCAQWRHKDTLAKDITPGASSCSGGLAGQDESRHLRDGSAAGGTREPATDGAHNHTAPAGGKDSPTAKPAALSGAGGPPSLLQRTLRAGQRGSRQQ